jgi:hypothetical protein
MEVDAFTRRWFDDRRGDRFSLDVSREDPVRAMTNRGPPSASYPFFHVYLKIAWHLSRTRGRDLAGVSLYSPTSRVALRFRRKEGCVNAAHHAAQTRGGCDRLATSSDRPGGKTSYEDCARSGSEEDTAVQRNLIIRP